VLVGFPVVVPRADVGSWIFLFLNDVEHFLRVGVVFDRLAMFVVVELLVRVSRFIVVYDQPVGFFNKEQFYRATACNATHGVAVAILSVCLYFCPSVRLSNASTVTKQN